MRTTGCWSRHSPTGVAVGRCACCPNGSPVLQAAAFLALAAARTPAGRAYAWRMVHDSDCLLPPAAAAGSHTGDHAGTGPGCSCLGASGSRLDGRRPGVRGTSRQIGVDRHHHRSRRPTSRRADRPQRVVAALVRACPRRSRRPDWPCPRRCRRWPGAEASFPSTCSGRPGYRLDRRRGTTRWSDRCRPG